MKKFPTVRQFMKEVQAKQAEKALLKEKAMLAMSKDKDNILSLKIKMAQTKELGQGKIKGTQNKAQIKEEEQDSGTEEEMEESAGQKVSA